MIRDARGRFAKACGCEFSSHTPEQEAALLRAASAFMERRRERRESGVHPTPLLDRIWGTEPGRYVGDPRALPIIEVETVDPVVARLMRVAAGRGRDR
jgi:hypothetical protein